MLLASDICAQDSTLYYDASVLFAGATGPTPFWVHANQQGNIPLDGSLSLAKVGIYKVYNPNNPRIFQWSGSLEAVGSYGKKDDNAFLSNAYLAAKIGFVEFLAGQKNAVTGIMDTTLTSGSLSVSGNARPVPGVRISIPEFVPMYITGGFLSVKASYSDGYLGGSRINFGSVRFIDKTYFHQKTLYLRFGRSADKLKIYGGFNHQAIWGGEADLMPLYKISGSKAYWYMATGKTFDHRKIGNHFGTVDIAGEWKGRSWSYFLYRQSIFETGSLFHIINYTDGLNGLRIKKLAARSSNANKFDLRTVLIEVVGTKDQMNAAPFNDLAIYERGNYYNHYIYRRGWSYKSEGMGSPLAPNSVITREGLPRSTSNFANNNRFWAFHTGMSAIWHNTNINFKGTYTRNFGSFLSPFETTAEQFSVALSGEKKIKKLKGLDIYSSLSCDIGKLYPDSYGILVGLRKNGFLD